MKGIYLITLCFLIGITTTAQTLKAKLDAAIKQLEKDSQLKHGLIGFSVIDAATGKPVYERNAEIGLAPASTQKIFTSIAAFEILGKDFRYKTSFGYDGKSAYDSISKGPLYIVPSGDPSFGSWRFPGTKPEVIVGSLFNAFKKKGIKIWWGGVISIANNFESQAIPNGWIWEDIGNYYGTGHYDLNWNENQYDLILKPGEKPGEDVIVKARSPKINTSIISELKTAAKGSGDNAYIYYEPNRDLLFVRGTIPCCVDSFVISGSFDGPSLFVNAVYSYPKDGRENEIHLYYKKKSNEIRDYTTLLDYYSPPLDSLNYYFLKRSINLYGEALIRTISREKSGIGSTEKGIELVKNLFEKIGIEKSAIDIIDGSGLSPQNRVTAAALTRVLQYARGRNWYSSFYYALPEINGMKMKSGLIGGVRSYAGYQKATNGKEYIFSIIVNNYNGSSSEMNKKLFKILDYLK